jgi:molecular chaperone GrpE
MHDDKEFPIDADAGDDEIEIEFVDPDSDVAPIVEQPREADEPDEPSAGEDAEDLRTELEHFREMYLRKLAEFDNFRKRVDRERGVDRRAAAEDFVRDLLPVLDNFERALEHADDDGGAFLQGVEMIAKQLWDVLERRGVAAVNPVDEPFDPELHEAVQRVDDGERSPGTVAFVMLKGYTMGERLIRPALVGVAVDAEVDDHREGEGGS